MPIMAIGGIIGGASALAAGGLGVLGTIGAIGSIVGGIGALTGNKTLAKIGAIAGLAGGLGAFASGKGWLGTAAGGEAVMPPNPFAEGGATSAMINAPSGAEFNLGGPPANPFASGDVMGMGDAIGASGASETFGGSEGGSFLDDGFAPNIQDTLGAPMGGDISSTIGQQNPEIANLLDSQPAPSPGLMDSVSPLGDNLGAPNPFAGSEGANALDGSSSPLDPIHSQSAAGDMTFDPTSDASLMGAGQQNGFQPPMPGAGQGTTPPNPFAPGAQQQGKGGIMGMFDKFFRNPNGTMNKDMMSIAAKFIGGIFDPGQKAQEELLKARLENEKQKLEMEKQKMAWGNSVPQMNFKTNIKPGDIFRPTSPTFNPVRLNTGGLFNAR